MVWLKFDLRIDDHEGLLAAASASSAVLPVYCIDYSQLDFLLHTPAGPEALVEALLKLRQELQQMGSNLIVAPGPWEETLPALATKVGAQAIIAEEEVEFKRQASVDVLESLAAKGIRAYHWSADVWPNSAFTSNYRTWKRQRPQHNAPLDAPASMPAVPADVPAGDVPSASELRAALKAHQQSRQPHPAIADMAAATQDVTERSIESQDAKQLLSSGQEWLAFLQLYLSSSSVLQGSNGAPALESAQGPSKALSVEQVASMVQQFEMPSAEGASFPKLFATALLLGTLSRRRVYHEAMSKASGSLPTRAAALTAESADFHWQLARQSEPWPFHMPDTVQRKHWRWQGFMTDYCEAQPASGKARPGAPAILLVHGFGAFGDHWRSNLQPLADQGFQVFAPTFPGFGRSEKAAVPYSQVLWSNFLRDFVVQVVGRPVVVAGNSIGGFISTSMAADNPSLVEGLALLNSAGPIDGSFSIQQWEEQARTKTAPPKWIVQLITNALFWYLERTIPGTLKWLYPTAPDRADKWLAEEIYRSACDSGSVAVFASVFYLPPPRALNYMINELYEKPTVLLTGGLDPLNDARGRTSQLSTLSPNAMVTVLEAGHCPHDEQPDQVNQGLLDFINQRVLSKAMAGSTS